MFRVFYIAFDFTRSLFYMRGTIFELAKRDFMQTYVSSYLGIAWAFINPLFTFAVIFMVFEFGLRGANKKDTVPFVAYLFCGQVGYRFFQEVIASATRSLIEYNFLVRKMNFRLSVLPVVKMLSSVWLHLFLVLILILVILLVKVPVSWYWLQIFYYLFGGMMFTLGLSWIFFSIQPFIPDLVRFVTMFLNVGFWATPVFWYMDQVPPRIRPYLELNPAYFLVSGYRNSLLYQKGFWTEPWLNLYFWGLTLLVMFIGMVVYHRLKPHFAEVV